MKYPSFHSTIIKSPEWHRWVKHQEQKLEWDVHESMDCGWLSLEHFAAFLEFVRKG